jgi:hypothetical protein
MTGKQRMSSATQATAEKHRTVRTVCIVNSSIVEGIMAAPGL